MSWTLRAYTRAEAAERLGITVNHLDVLVHRLRGIETLFSEKQGRNRENGGGKLDHGSGGIVLLRAA